MTAKMDFKGILAFCAFIFTVCALIIFFIPQETDPENSIAVVSENAAQEQAAVQDEVSNDEEQHTVSYTTAVKEYAVNKTDPGLELYRSVTSRSAVEWFYTHITESREVTLAILENADKNDIPLPLAFALAYTESRFNPNAVNKNTNSSTDRGLYQLNSNSFPNLTEEEFFEPSVSAKYGMEHLRFCIETAGNEVAALAMYNAGTTKVRSGRTPQMTLNYVSNIIAYKTGLEELFNQEVASFYTNSITGSSMLALYDTAGNQYPNADIAAL